MGDKLMTVVEVARYLDIHSRYVVSLGRGRKTDPCS